MLYIHVEMVSIPVEMLIISTLHHKYVWINPYYIPIYDKTYLHQEKTQQILVKVLKKYAFKYIFGHYMHIRIKR